MRRRFIGSALALGMAMVMPTEGRAQTDDETGTAETPATDTAPGVSDPPAAETEVPPVEVIQPKPETAPAPRVTARPRTPAPAPRPVTYTPPPPAPVEPIEPELVLPNLLTQPTPQYYGPPGGAASFERSIDSAQSPINPVQGILPSDLQNFSSAASRVTREQIDEQDPLTTNDILQRVPGVNIVADDGLARHGGIGIRGAPPRRSRKVLVMEDGRSINMSLWLDPSAHYVPPPERIESVEVVRGSVIYGPNNNFGAVNFKNLQPFGPNQTEFSGEGGTVSIDGANPGDSSAAKWHAHTRRTAGNWGTVVSYTGANAQGAWDTERLRYNDFYAALGWKGVKSDATVSAVYFRQRDNYDEANLEFEEEGEEEEEGDLEEDEELEEEEETTFRAESVEQAFFNDIKHCKTCYNPGSVFNTYNADVVLLQGVYNYYFDADTTLNYRVYSQYHRRDRYQNFEGADPRDAETDFSALFVGDDVLIPEGVMLGRLRTYEHIGTELRNEFANRPFFFGLKQDIETGVRYEHHDFSNRNFFGRQGQILEDGDKRGTYVFDTFNQADAWSFFAQTSIPVTQALNIVPGARLDHYRISRDIKAGSVEEGEGEELEECEVDGTEFFDGEECAVFGVDFLGDPLTESFEETHVLPGIGFSWGLLGRTMKTPDKPVYHTTMYGGYNRGLTMNVLRETNVRFPPPSELGDNYQVGVRSTGIKGVTFDVAGFYKLIQDFQVKGSSTDASGNNIYTNLDEVEIPGFEVYARLDTRPYIGGKLNPYLEGTFTYNDGRITEGTDPEGESLVGNLIPEASREVAYLTAGIESLKGWNASVSFNYRGKFFTDEENTPYRGDFSGEDGLVPSVWLVNARANYTIPNTNAVVYVSAENLADELYIVDREDGIKPGLGRTVMFGGKYRW